MEKKKNSKIFKKLNFVEIKNGEDVRKNKWEDYSNFTAVKKKDYIVKRSQIHEFDYFQFLFEDYNIIKSKNLILKNSTILI